MPGRRTKACPGRHGPSKLEKFSVFILKGSIGSITFTEEAQGSSYTRGDRFALSFIRRADLPFEIPPAVIEIGGVEELSSSALSVESVSCVDNQAKPVSGAEVVLQ